MPDEPPYVHLHEYDNFLQRTEWIWIAPPRSGLTTLLNKYTGSAGAYPEDGHTGPGRYEAQAETAMLDVRVIAGMFRHKTQWPEYIPRVIATSHQWRRLRGYLRHIPDHFVAQFSFPREAFYRWWPVSPAEFMATFGKRWLERHGSDATGRIIPELAYTATVLSARAAGDRTRARARAKLYADWLQTHHAWLLPILIHIAPESDAYFLHGKRFTMTRPRLLSRLRTFRWRYDQPMPMPAADLIQRLEDLGAMRYVTRGMYVFAHPWAAGITYLKKELTFDAVRAMM